MDRWLGLMAASLLLTAGCLGGDDDATNTTDDDNAPPLERPAPPQDIEKSEEVTGGVDPFNFVTGMPCSTPVSGCFETPFTANTSVNVTAALSWTNQASDFDLYLYSGDEQIAASGATPPGTSEGFSRDLDAGDYRLVVVAWAVTQDTYTLTAAFGYAPEEPEEEEEA